MFIRRYWVLIMVFLLAIAGVCVYMLATQPEKPLIKIYKTVKPTEKPTAEVPSETDKGGHFHTSSGTSVVAAAKFCSTSDAFLEPVRLIAIRG